MHSTFSLTAILLLAGSGERFNHKTPKQFHLLQGKKIYLHTLAKFASSNLFQTIILVCHPDWIDMVKEETKACSPLIIPGGKTRQESSYKGLLACPEKTTHVMIHDAVRPFVSHKILEENIRLVRLHSAVDTCIPSTDTLVHTPSGKEIDHIPERAAYWRGQTPQSFEYKKILRAHQKTAKKEATDDCTLLLEQGEKVYIALGSETNLKITSEWDLFFAEKILEAQNLL